LHLRSGAASHNKEKLIKPILQFGDVHFGVSNSNHLVFEGQMEFFEHQVFPYILDNNIKDVMSMGDVFHNRSNVDGYILQELNQRFFGWFERNKVNFHVIVGNHDCYYKNTLSHHMFKPQFNEFQYCTYYDTVTKIEIGDYIFAMVPWIIDRTSFVLPTGVDVVIGHFEIVSFPMVKGADAVKGFDPDFFKSVKLIESGHFHIKSNKGNINFLGSTQQLSWNDFCEPKGFWLLKGDFNLEFVENTVNPKHVKIIYNEVDTKVELTAYGLYDADTMITPKEAVSLAENHYVKLITHAVKSQSKLEKLHQAMMLSSKNNYKIEVVAVGEIQDTLDFSALEASIKANSSVGDTIVSFISEMPPVDDIDQEMLQNILNQLYTETQQLMTETECNSITI
jgi:DNA repair exonuclease SbcCD nuclease subunit